MQSTEYLTARVRLLQNSLSSILPAYRPTTWDCLLVPRPDGKLSLCPSHKPTSRATMIADIQSMFAMPSISEFCLYLYILYLLALVLYRLYLSPIAHFPSSKITAVSGWYGTYLDVVKGGQFTFQIQEWHRQYVRHPPLATTTLIRQHLKGPITRINPTELHIADPDFYDIAYSSSLSVNKLEASSTALVTRTRYRQPLTTPFIAAAV